jgi:hypothetical protein
MLVSESLCLALRGRDVSLVIASFPPQQIPLQMLLILELVVH